MRHRRTKAELALGPVTCGNCGTSTDTPRRGCCPPCYQRWLRTDPGLVRERFKTVLQAATRLDALCTKYADVA